MPSSREPLPVVSNLGSADLGATLHRLDLAAFRWATQRPAPKVDRVLYPLTRAADHSKLWVAVAALLAARGGRDNRRAALRGLLSVAATSAVTNAVVKPLASRARPTSLPSEWLTRAARMPSSSSFPSGHSASASAFAVGAALEVPQLGGPLGLAAAAVGWSRVRTRVHYPGDVIAGFATGAAVAYATTRWWRLRPSEPAQVREVRTRPAALDTDGTGLVVVANPSAGSSRGSNGMVDGLRKELPAASFVELEEGADLLDALEKAATGDALGIIGGDGSINAAASVALRVGKPLAVFPGGTLNHFARDLGLRDTEDTVDAIKAMNLGAVDVGLIDGHPFLNTASFGSYAALVDLREKHEARFGKWPAMAYALVQTLRSAKPVDVTINGTRRSLWLIFIGNSEYGPPGLAPSWREHLDDGMLDVRWVEDVGPFSRLRLIVAALAGQTGRTSTYQRSLVPSLTVESHDGPLRMARDGETFDGSGSFTVQKSPRRLTVFLTPSDASRADDNRSEG